MSMMLMIFWPGLTDSWIHIWLICNKSYNKVNFQGCTGQHFLLPCRAGQGSKSSQGRAKRPLTNKSMYFLNKCDPWDGAGQGVQCASMLIILGILLSMLLGWFGSIAMHTIYFQRWDLSLPSLPAAVSNFCQRCKFLHFHSFLCVIITKAVEIRRN